jgi:hypothetical protein
MNGGTRKSAGTVVRPKYRSEGQDVLGRINTGLIQGQRGKSWLTVFLWWYWGFELTVLSLLGKCSTT